MWRLLSAAPIGHFRFDIDKLQHTAWTPSTHLSHAYSTSTQHHGTSHISQYTPVLHLPFPSFDLQSSSPFLLFLLNSPQTKKEIGSRRENHSTCICHFDALDSQRVRCWWRAPSGRIARNLFTKVVGWGHWTTWLRCAKFPSFTQSLARPCTHGYILQKVSEHSLCTTGIALLLLLLSQRD